MELSAIATGQKVKGRCWFVKGRNGRCWAGGADGGKLGFRLFGFAFDGSAAGLAGVGAFARFLEAIGLPFDLHDRGIVGEPAEESHDGRSTLSEISHATP